MKTEVKIFPPYGCFCVISYLAVIDNAAFMVDAPGNNSEVFGYLEKNNIRLEKILLTHGHTDHIAGLAEAAEKTGAEVIIGADDKEMLYDSYLNLTDYFGLPPVSEYKGEVTEVSDGTVIDFHGMQIKVISVPGHTKGSVLYVTDDIIFSGDTLFKNSVGRTDMPGGNTAELMKSLKKMSELFGSSDHIILSGHTPPTSMKDELMNNPYLSEL